MGRFTGYICDNNGCGNTADGSGKDGNEPPENWFSVGIKTHSDVRYEPKLMCSNRCLADFGVKRYLGDLEREPVDIDKLLKIRGSRVSKEGREGMLVAYHKRGRHETRPRENCPLCQEELAS